MLSVQIYTLPDEDYVIDSSYDMYKIAFRPLLKLAAQNHMMDYYEFEQMWHNPYIEKHVVYDDGELVGLSVVTRHLNQWSLISEAYFEHNFPEHFDSGTLWYVGFVCVANKYQSSGAFQMLLESMSDNRKDGMFFMDFCTHNLDRKIITLCTRALTSSDPTATMTHVDSQEFWVVRWANN